LVLRSEAGIAPPAGARAATGAVHDLYAQMRAWLAQSAYPLWAQAGYDHARGGFHERLGADGPVETDSRRARVQVRQVYAFANAPSMGWMGDPVPLVSGGLDFFLSHYRRADGLFRTLCAPDGAALDEQAFLYDQAFVLLALAASQKVLGPTSALIHESQALHSAIERLLRHHGPGFDSGLPQRLPLLSNPHMHLLEAALAWEEVSHEPKWGALREELTDLALTHLIDARSGAVLEFFDQDWQPLSGDRGRTVEPGHLFEWAWLLQRCGGERANAAALRLIHLAERHGVRRGVALNALLDDFTIHDAQARLWPQAERLKALSLAAVNDGRYWPGVAQAGCAILRYIAVAPEGLWYDTLTVNKRFIAEPSPASSLYHLVAAIAQLGGALEGKSAAD
jgi:mannose/cellobiose epimerase-like protein (N-acyl-D-glucosamine 2-epimerase family)